MTHIYIGQKSILIKILYTGYWKRVTQKLFFNVQIVDLKNNKFRNVIRMNPSFEHPTPPPNVRSNIGINSKDEQFQFQLVTPENQTITVTFHREETIGILKVIPLV